MSTVTKKGFIIDCFHDNMDMEIPNLQQLTDTQLYTIFLHNKCPNISKRMKDLHPIEANFEKVTVSIENDNKILAFFAAKNRLDLNGVRDICIICPPSQCRFWSALSKLFFTPVHQWSLSCEDPDMDHKDQTRSSLDSDVKNEVQFALHSIPADGKVEVIRSKLIPENLFYHGFTTRNGGISTVENMASLNLIYVLHKCDPEIVIEENRHRLALSAGFSLESFRVARAVHGNTVWVVGSERPTDGFDALVTNQKGVTIAAPGADCVTMVFADPVNRAVGAAHAGWKGTLACVAQETVKTMSKEFGSKADDIMVAMGPSICENCFQIDQTESQRFAAIHPPSVIWKNNQSKPFIDLKAANRALLQQIGVQAANIDEKSVSLCTLCNPAKFFSHQRDGIPFGNQLGFIGLR